MQPSQSGGDSGPCVGAVIIQPSQSGGDSGPCDTGPLVLPLESSVTHIKRDPPINLFTIIPAFFAIAYIATVLYVRLVLSDRA
jgi:hypothetical protein